MQNIARITALIKAGGDVNACDESGATSLHVAAENDNVAGIRMLVQASANVNAADALGQTPCHLAAQCACAGAMNELVASGANVNAVDANGRTPFHIAAESGDEAVIGALLVARASVVARDKLGRTPLHFAANAAVVRWLIIGGADLNAIDLDGMSPCLAAANRSNDEVVSAIVAAGVDANSTNKHGATPCHFAADRGNARMIEVLVAAGANVNAVDCRRSTPLHVATNEKVVWALTSAGADVSALNSDGKTACLSAASRGFVAVVRAVIAAGANINALTTNHRTLLHDAVENGWSDMVDTAMFAGVDLSIVDRHGQTARDIAVALQRDDLIRRLDEASHRPSCESMAQSLSNARQLRTALDDICSACVVENGTASVVNRLSALNATTSHIIEQFDSLQERLRSSKQLTEEFVTKRESLRGPMLSHSETLIAAFDDAASVRRQVTRSKSTLATWPRDDDSAMDVVQWRSSAQKITLMHASITEKCAQELKREMGSLSIALDTGGGDPTASARRLSALFGRCAIASAFESAALQALRMPGRVIGTLICNMADHDALLDACAQTVERARQVRAVRQPDGARFLAAQAALKSASIELASAEAHLKHADDNDDVAALTAKRAQCIAAHKLAAQKVTVAVVELGAMLVDFPELVLLFPSARLDLLMGGVGFGGDAARVLRTLDSYDERTPIAGTRHTVERASIGGQACALKLFTLDNNQQRAFLKEARQLRHLAHANVVQLRAAFVHQQFGVIEMPLYEFGSLWKWRAAARRSDDVMIAVLRQTLCGLEHVHRMGVVHADVKPDNVFVGADGVARLGDFEVSQEDQSNSTRTMTRVGMTDFYCAPELERKLWAQSVAKPSKASDVFAFGATMFDIMCGSEHQLLRPIALERLLLRDIGALVGALTAPAPTDRPTASAALAMSVFAPPPPGMDAARDRRQCLTCFDPFWVHEGIHCDAADSTHFLCNVCAKGHVKAIVDEPIIHSAVMRCCASGCTHEISVARLASVIPESLFAMYMRQLTAAHESRVYQECQLRFEAKLAAQARLLRGELPRDEAVAAHRLHVTDRLLCLQCPQCTLVFGSFKGCFALHCDRCGTEFCAWCLANCGRDTTASHRHIAHCDKSLSRSINGDHVQFELCHRERRKRLVREYFARDVPEDLRSDVLAALTADLAGVGVEV